MIKDTYNDYKKAIWITTVLFALAGSVEPTIGTIAAGLEGFFTAYIVCLILEYRKQKGATNPERQAYKAAQKKKKLELKAEREAERQRILKIAEERRITAERNKFKCPNCGSKNIQALGIHKKGFSTGKAVGGAILTGGVGALAGFAGKKTNKTDFVCNECGRRFIL
ncbi:hypothetical protein [Ligilactobacillus salivarius]|uniref:hypothetical protein n=1 Tax=Ligilactobacillus salivarius TaxID=1624 RepID=UPI001CBBA95D|nr:hypothetical protein [Ligilactobacillus salivarius]